MVSRVYVQRKPGFDTEAQQLFAELRSILGIENVENVILYNRYDVEGLPDEVFNACVNTVFSEPQTDISTVGADAPTDKDAFVFAVEFLPGQFDQRADSAAECIQLMTQQDRPLIRSARVYELSGNLSTKDIDAIKHYVINPVEAREALLELPESLQLDYTEPKPVATVQNFTAMSEAELAEFIEANDLAMDIADVAFCQRYFAEEQREPTIAEIKVIDTYWSDHCRHTTFNTHFEEVQIDDELVSKAYERYHALRKELGREDKPECLMDLGTIGARALKARGILTGLDESEEVNACTVKITCDVDGVDEEWLYLFKNETHNHPTEIEPFGGAATCVGGAIRDPLSGRSYVYQAMRVSGAADPHTPVNKTLPGKLPQRKLVTTAAAGYSSYGNQIGLATGQVSEVYHPGYEAKHMEVGAVVGATPANHVRREEPLPSDVVILVGGRTGRDGIGGATGSSKAHKATSLETCGAQVQKGNAPIERKLQRLFRRGEVARLIKRCNDFGAGGVSVAIGELANGLHINLNAVPKKYEGLDGTELAISESQERMAVALAADDVDAFIAFAHEENLEATPVATVTEEARVVMEWNGTNIVDISREFLATNGAAKHIDIHITKGDTYAPEWSGETLEERLCNLLTNPNICSNKGMSERFDSTIGASTVLMPFGGIHQLTPIQAMVAKLPVEGETTTCSAMSWGFNPYFTAANNYAGSYAAVVESVAKLIATGFSRKNTYLTFQEFFESLYDNPTRWGKPAAALLGALDAQIDLSVGSIGGKDSMSGTFEDINVAPTLISFATAIGNINSVCSPEFKNADSTIVCIHPFYDKATLLPHKTGLLGVFDLVENLIAEKSVQAASTLGYGCGAEALFKMCVGNRFGVAFDDSFDTDMLFTPAYGSFILELSKDAELPKAGEGFEVTLVGSTTDAYLFTTKDEEISMALLQNAWEGFMEDIFPYRALESDQSSTGGAKSHTTAGAATRISEMFQVFQGNTPTGCISRSAFVPQVFSTSVPEPRVIIPVFPGTNCEFDSARAWKRVGAKPTTFVVNNLTPTDIAQSAHDFAHAIKNSQIIMIPGGFSAGDEPDGSAKMICSFFRNPEVAEAVTELLEDRDGLMLGICNGFQALIKLGLIPFGKITEMNKNCPTLTYNTIGRHQSRLVRTRVASTLSPWYSMCNVGDVHTVAISHGEGRLVLPGYLRERLSSFGQVATQYVNPSGEPSMDLSINPNGSVLAIEGLTSPDGRILGKMGHSERYGAGLYQNIPDATYEPIFEGGINYFS